MCTHYTTVHVPVIISLHSMNCLVRTIDMHIFHCAVQCEFVSTCYIKFRIVADLPQRRIGFDLRPVQLGVVVEKLEPGQVFLLVLSSSCQYHSTNSQVIFSFKVSPNRRGKKVEVWSFS
jgi:hypothetical protein